MKKLVIPVVALMALLTAMPSCTNADKAGQQTTDTIDTTALTPRDTAPQPQQLKGVAIDGAMNSIFVADAAKGDTVEFAYPDIDKSLVDEWEIGDTVIVKFVATANGDSVLRITNAKNLNKKAQVKPLHQVNR